MQAVMAAEEADVLRLLITVGSFITELHFELMGFSFFVRTDALEVTAVEFCPL